MPAWGGQWDPRECLWVSVADRKMGAGKKLDPLQGLVALSGNGGEVGDLARGLLQGWEETGMPVIADRRECTSPA